MLWRLVHDRIVRKCQQSLESPHYVLAADEIVSFLEMHRWRS